jgi:Rod binding domain-containing protein
MPIDSIGQSDLNGLEASLVNGRRGDLEIARLKADQAAGDAQAASERFESYFATMLVKEMRSGLQSGFFGEEAGSDTYSSWFDDFVGQSLAKSGAFDLTRLIEGERALALTAAQTDKAGPESGKEPAAMGPAVRREERE